MYKPIYAYHYLAYYFESVHLSWDRAVNQIEPHFKHQLMYVLDKVNDEDAVASDLIPEERIMLIKKDFEDINLLFNHLLNLKIPILLRSVYVNGEQVQDLLMPGILHLSDWFLKRLDERHEEIIKSLEKIIGFDVDAFLINLNINDEWRLYEPDYICDFDALHSGFHDTMLLALKLMTEVQASHPNQSVADYLGTLTEATKQEFKRLWPNRFSQKEVEVEKKFMDKVERNFTYPAGFADSVKQQIFQLRPSDLYEQSGRQFYYTEEQLHNPIEVFNIEFLKSAMHDFDWLNTITNHLNENNDNEQAIGRKLTISDTYTLHAIILDCKDSLSRYQIETIYFSNEASCLNSAKQYFPLYALNFDNFLHELIVLDRMSHYQDSLGEKCLRDPRFTLTTNIQDHKLNSVLKRNALYLFQITNNRIKRYDYTNRLTAMQTYISFLLSKGLNDREANLSLERFLDDGNDTNEQIAIPEGDGLPF